MKYSFIIFIFVVFGFSQVQWNTEVVDSSAGLLGLSVSMYLSDDTVPHVAYTLTSGQSFVLYSYKNGSTWIKETIDSSLYGGPYWGLPFYGVSLVSSQDSISNISYYYYDSLNNVTEVCFASRDSSGWQHEVVDLIDSTIEYPQKYYTSLCFDTTGLPGIAYSCWDLADSTQVIKYLHHNGTSWDSFFVDDSCSVWDFGPSLSIDDQNQPHIAYYQNDTMKYVYYDSQIGAWIITHTKYIGSPGERACLSLELDSLNYPRIAHLDNGFLAYSWWDGSSWYEDIITSIGEWGVAINLGLDTLENPHISYTVEFNFWLEYCCKNTSWHLYGPVDPDSNHTVLDHSLVVDILCNPHVSYESGYLMYAKGTDSYISENIVDTIGNSLIEVYPKPFINTLKIINHMKGTAYSTAEVVIYDIAGRIVRTLNLKQNEVVWEGRNNQNEKVSPGVYFIKVEAPNHTEINKVILLD